MLRGRTPATPGGGADRHADRDVRATGAGLPVAALDPLDAMSDLEGPAVPVESRPAQAEHLTAAHRIRQREDDDQLEAMTSRRIQQTPRLLVLICG
jgi:hypothetical protein